MHGSNGLKCFKLMPQNDFIRQNIFQCSKTAFDLVLKLIYDLEDLEKSRVNYTSEKHFEMVEFGKLPRSTRYEQSTASVDQISSFATTSVVRSIAYPDQSTELDRNYVKRSKMTSFL